MKHTNKDLELLPYKPFIEKNVVDYDEYLIDTFDKVFTMEIESGTLLDDQFEPILTPTQVEGTFTLKTRDEAVFSFKLYVEPRVEEDEEGNLVTIENEPTTDEQPSIHKFTRCRSISHPASIFNNWSREEKLSIGVYEVEEPEIPEGYYVTDWAYEMRDGFVEGIPTLELYPEPEVYVPEEVSPAQGQIALIQMGHWDTVVNHVESIEDPTEKAIAEVALYRTTAWRRDSPFLSQATTLLNLTQEDLDNLFILAASINV